MELSIIITSYKNPSLLKLCIDSVFKTVKDVEYEIIVCDTVTEEDTEMLMRENYPEIKFLPHKENTGFSYLVNKGIKNSRGEYFLVLNSDTIMTENAVKSLLDFVKNNPKVGIAGPKLLNFNGGLQSSCFDFYTPMTVIYRRTFLGRTGFGKKHLAKFAMEDYDHKTPKKVGWVMGSAIMTSKKAVEKVGLMDERFRMYFEDTEWCRRFWENGYEVVYYPLSSVFHYHGLGSKDKSAIRSLFFNKLAWIHITSALKFFIKYWGKPKPVYD